MVLLSFHKPSPLMLEKIIAYSVRNKFLVLLLVTLIAAFGGYALTQVPIGATPDVTNNQVQVITTSRNLATEDVEKFLTYPVELEMANLPGVKEIRSTSKFGLSVVTVVFEEDMGIYLPRQLIAEKIKAAEEKIPQQFGKPFMGPITTGLGEIYQYVLEVDSAHQGEYSPTELRTIQDWVIRRQMAGIQGVVEVNTWGGKLKQYEVAVNPEKLRNLEIGLNEVYQALRDNNAIAGGAYIEKNDQAYFVRGEGLAQSLDDLRQTVVSRRGTTPVLVEDIATVGYGSAPRFGAVTANGTGEKVLGQVMMLRGASPNATIQRVKERMAEVEQNLPPGIQVNDFLDRSDLIGRTTSTIAENLLLGCLIVIFVVILLLGDWRSGLVVASVIPLSLLFALGLMYLTGVDANLMSLGAIDFGIIIDGAVIVTEFILFSVTTRRNEVLATSGAERQTLMDKITIAGSYRMMHSAIFGQIIIIIVFIPILSLSGVEGKMFTPMALTFCFALLGTMIMGFTYVPVMAALFVRPLSGKPTFTTRLIGTFQRGYRPLLKWAFRWRKGVLAGAGVLLLGSGWVFSQMGGEFVPTLDEGDFVIQPILKTGTSLEKTMDYSTRMEKLVREFPEVDQAVSRIGAAEVPTDPMSMEQIDLMVTLHPQATWTTASSKDALIDTVKSKLRAHIPQVDYEFTQPIEMRFNELITGVRADLAVKIFGEDMDRLHQLGMEVEELIQDVPGAADIALEKTAGLPQMSVRFRRDKLSRHGLSIKEVNDIVAMGFAGKTTGIIYDGERRFDLKLRFQEDYRLELNDLQRSLIALPNGQQVPLEELAEITYTTGPAQISRDNTRRRVVVRVNVRDRDLESVVGDVSNIIDEQLELPVGYSVEYGGQFENLRSARKRLMIAVPVALLLIFILLYFAFQSVRKALMIYSAIPLAAVGGILFLFLRDMPFSISAGVGFIALFGVAVLNGIVLLEEFRNLRRSGRTNLYRIVLEGTHNRLRPVLLTATSTALGFLPMAVSTSAGAEVQRPLASVVIGGLITATVLTMVVLPLFYITFEKSKSSIFRPVSPGPSGKITLGLLVLLFLPLGGWGQSLSREEVVERALEHNQGLQAAQLEVEQRKALRATAFDPGNTEVFSSFNENEIAPEGAPLQFWGLSQSFDFPTTYTASGKVKRARKNLAEEHREVTENEIALAVSRAYLRVQYFQALKLRYQQLDTLLERYFQAAQKRYQQGATDYLEKVSAQSRYRENQLELQRVTQKYRAAQSRLAGWVQDEEWTEPPQVEELELLAQKAQELEQNPAYQRAEAQVELAEDQRHLARQAYFPKLNLKGMRGASGQFPDAVYYGWQVGLSFPLFAQVPAAREKAARLRREKALAQLEDFRFQYQGATSELRKKRQAETAALNYYRNTGREMSRELRRNARQGYQRGALTFLEFAQLIEQATQIELRYLASVYRYNSLSLQLRYFTQP